MFVSSVLVSLIQLLSFTFMSISADERFSGKSCSSKYLSQQEASNYVSGNRIGVDAGAARSANGFIHLFPDTNVLGGIRFETTEVTIPLPPGHGTGGTKVQKVRFHIFIVNNSYQGRTVQFAIWEGHPLSANPDYILSISVGPRSHDDNCIVDALDRGTEPTQWTLQSF